MLAVIWHFWLGFFIMVGVVLAFVAVFVGFLRTTQAPRYGRDE